MGVKRVGRAIIVPAAPVLRLVRAANILDGYGNTCLAARRSAPQGVGGAICAADGVLRGVEGNRHQRRSAPRTILARIKAFAAQGVGVLHQERLGFRIHPTAGAGAGAGACVAGRGHINRAGLVVAAESLDHAAIAVEVCPEATACSAA